MIQQLSNFFLAFFPPNPHTYGRGEERRGEDRRGQDRTGQDRQDARCTDPSGSQSCPFTSGRRPLNMT